MSAVRYLLDDEHSPLASKEGDSNQYIYGEMSGHDVVIGFLPYGSQGIGAAATVATDMRRSFPAIQLRLLVDISGGVPTPTNDIRLGDVVVGMPGGSHGGVVQYERGGWRRAIVVMQSDHLAKESRISGFLSELISRYPLLKSSSRERHPVSSRQYTCSKPSNV